MHIGVYSCRVVIHGSGTSRTPYISVNSIWYTFNLVHHPFHIQAISYTAISYPIHYVYCNPVYYTIPYTI